MAYKFVGDYWGEVEADDFASASVEARYSIDGAADVVIETVTTTALYEDTGHPTEITGYSAAYNWLIPSAAIGSNVVLKLVDTRQEEEPVEFGPYDIYAAAEEGDYGSNYPYGESYYKDEGSDGTDDAVVGVGQDDNHFVCFSLALDASQGIAFSENTGDAFPFVEPGFTGLEIEDSNGILRQLTFNDRDGKLYDIATKDGPSNSDQEKVWTDGQDADGDGGTAIVPKVRFASDEGTFEHYWITLLIAHIFARCAEDKYRGASGYDTAGLPDGIEFDMSVFVDGERSTASRTVSDVPVTGDIHTDEKVDGHRIAIELSANMGCHIIAGKKFDYKVADRPIGTGVMTEDEYQEEMCLPELWFSREPFGVDRATGLSLSSTELAKLTECEGPDDVDWSAMQFDEAVTFPSVLLTGATLMIWHQDIASITIGGVAVSLTDYATQIGDWTLSYAKDITASGEVVVTPSGTGKVFDFKILDEKTVSDEAIAYYFNNINSHEGDVVLP